MTAHRHKAAAAAFTATTALLTVALGAGPAEAHGAPVSPVSRAAACAPQLGLFPESAACREATAKRGRPFDDWDNIRVAGVDGRDRQVIPDGRLCSGGKDEFSSLDQPRSDWPATRLAPGDEITVRYMSTIPHEGEFQVYLSKPGYDPAKPLTWSEIPKKPFMTAENPRLVNGAYRISGRLPADRTGRQMLFTVWRNTSTPDTYYSCSDVVFPDAAPGAAPGKGAHERVGAGGREDHGSQPFPSPTPASTPTPAASNSSQAPPAAGAGAQDAADPGPQAEAVSNDESENNGGLLFGVGGVVVLVAGALVGTAALRRRQRS